MHPPHPDPLPGGERGNRPLGEFGRITRFFKPLAAGFPGARGLRDDAAVFGVPEGRELVVTTDAMVAGVHFFPDDAPADIAAKLMRSNLSDLAAMGAEPLAYTLVTALPRGLDESWLEGFAAGLGEDQHQFGIALAGGDSVSTSGPITLSVTAFGLVPTGRALPRWGGRSGDRVFVTGSIGDAALGLEIAYGRLDIPDEQTRAHLLRRMRRPDPRTTVGPRLIGLASGAMDVSDGLVADLGHLCEESGCAALLHAAAVPLSDAARGAIDGDPVRLALAITGGDDYELLFTAPPAAREALETLSADCGVAIAEIGELRSGTPGEVSVLDAAGSLLPLTRRGWDHF
ncbi:thiamine-phosphate kinase [Azospirillum lipoferum]|uniref:Thiamine-monophosphate kinase n=2 Tax=Azospirillum lipoferum TaxID=193 RepID=A0A5A9GSE0_AZOLI|nr:MULTISPECIES: thiamine-phosphate kinase [Azospirillum]KAA0597358.1 thiamine-phosphate kinase [Azospirillum lipoferum]MDW5535982.1 thiamine-phosphate kinase [Azospirillum sp. NL1]